LKPRARVEVVPLLPLAQAYVMWISWLHVCVYVMWISWITRALCI